MYLPKCLIASKAFPFFSLLCLNLLLTIPFTSTFNMDLKSPVILRPPDQTDIHFGFSLAHIFNGTERTLLVGAPKANTTQDVASPGALYSCRLDGSDPQCHQLTVDTRKAADKYQPWITEDLKGDQRLGFSLAANDDSIVVCAPRWHIFDSRTTGIEDLPLGICFAAKAPDFQFKAFSPPFMSTTAIDGKMSFQNKGSCQFGISLAYVKDRNSVSFGSPGCWIWQGDTWEVNLDKLEEGDSYRTVQQLRLQDVDLTYDDGAKGFSSIADLYLGYSVATITYEETSAIVSAMPRSVGTSELKVYEKNQVLGPMVNILIADANDKNKLTVLDTIKPPLNEMEATMESMFSYFGYSLTAADVNGDGLDDVIVGAPLYHNITHHDQGAIFVYTQNRFTTGGEVRWAYEMKGEKDAPLRMGSESYGRFGSSVAAIGDIDSDGFQDIAVGAPFLKDGGAVFIYLGSSKGLGVKHSQMIKASDLPSSVQPVSGFGFSIAQNLRGQSNRGHEIAVGAYSSDVVAVFKSKEVISLEWNLTFSKPMDLTKDECLYTTATKLVRYPCVEAEVCLKYHKLKSSTQTRQTLMFAVSLNADINHQPKRLFFENGKADTQLTMQLMENAQKCARISIMARKDMLDGVNPFTIQREVSFKKQDEDKVVLDPRIKLSDFDQLDILVPCVGAEAGLCKSKLQLTHKVLTSYHLDNQQPINVSFTVGNPGEPAYNTRLTVSSHGDLRIQATPENLTCEMRNDEHIVCDIDVIFNTGSKIDFILSMAPTQKFFQSMQTHKDKFKLNASLSTSSIIVEPDKAKEFFDIPIKVDGSLDLTKDTSDPAIVFYNSSSYYKPPHEAKTEEELGPEILHTYKIFNKNNYDIYRTQITIKWPLKIDGQYLLYLLDMPEFTGTKPVCNFTNGDIDKYSLKNKQIIQAHGDFRRAPAVGQVKMGNRRVTLVDAVDGKSLDFLEFRCIFGKILSDGEVFIRLRSRLVEKTLENLKMGSKLGEVSSWSQIQVLELPLGVKDLPAPLDSSISTLISYKNESPEDVVPWWVYLVSALGGILLLVVIILILWKCGFFKRKRADNADGADGATGNAEGDEEEGEGEKEEEEQPLTPESAMLKETEGANGDFEFSKPRPLDPL